MTTSAQRNISIIFLFIVLIGPLFAAYIQNDSIFVQNANASK